MSLRPSSANPLLALTLQEAREVDADSKDGQGEPSRLVREGYRPRQHIPHEVPERKAEERGAEDEEESEEGDMLDAPGVLLLPSVRFLGLPSRPSAEPSPVSA